ncbi:alpha/beta hydrolase [Rubellicoccus peritrichatus]|uniref:Alpha/beta hydrolase fold domain-containing protein n=1 Tax=Rubellicoccus peritrichatus TaxID=3080537 RepID=A0AAQ3LE28_9BACT|nr:alpha/beta hydrolase fold domain-containing protein [Puniceicoccus sp. CR14]WOO42774.1 alpha/beta hydrolase fold domain-containing protein [Puniceicoccus sp. CR14]
MFQSQPAQAREHPITPNESAVFKETQQGDLKLNIFKPKEESTSPRPAIVFFFGGGWYGGNPGQFFPHAELLAKHGIVGLTAEYRVEKRHGTDPRKSVEDGKSAMRWIRAHANELGVDPNQIIAGGGSAGGHVAATTAFITDFDSPNDDLTVSPVPNALVLFNPVVDNGPDGYGYDRVKDYWEAFSPMHNIGENPPPTVFMLGTKDELIPVSVAENFKKGIEENGGICEVHLYEDQPHGFFNFSNRENYNATTAHMLAFLKAHGFIE